MQTMKPFIVPEMTLKIDQGHSSWHKSIGQNHVVLDSGL